MIGGFITGFVPGFVIVPASNGFALMIGGVITGFVPVTSGFIMISGFEVSGYGFEVSGYGFAVLIEGLITPCIGSLLLIIGVVFSLFDDSPCILSVPVNKTELSSYESSSDIFCYLRSLENYMNSLEFFFGVVNGVFSFNFLALS